MDWMILWVWGKRNWHYETIIFKIIGDPTKSKTKLGWKPKYALDRLIEEMALADLRLFQKDQLLKKEGF